jgi:hypothetical protein
LSLDARRAWEQKKKSQRYEERQRQSNSHSVSVVHQANSTCRQPLRVAGRFQLMPPDGMMVGNKDNYEL